MRTLGLSYNEPGDRCKELVALIREHSTLECIDIIELRKEDLGTRGKFNIGKALMERTNDSRRVSWNQIGGWGALNLIARCWPSS